MDVVFLSFANSQDRPLSSLSYEDDKVFGILINRSLKGHFLIHRDSFTTLEKINDYLGRYKDNLALFLYSGHAGTETLHLVGNDANAKGIAYQLGASAKGGKLKIVILNGCSTKGQVDGLLEAGVPVVVATSAPVEDKSAAEFSIRFFQCLSEKRLTVLEAFNEALGPAQSASKTDLKVNDISRGGFELPGGDNSIPVWGLFSKSEDAINQNPLPSGRKQASQSDFVPNEKLTGRLFETLLRAGNSRIRSLREREEEGEYIELGDKQTDIVNVLPFPVSSHLQKLLCPVEYENEGFDKISISRLEQTGTCFHMGAEIMAFVMIAQLWEQKLEEPGLAIPENLMDALKRYFNMKMEERAVFDHLEFIIAIRQFLDPVLEKRSEQYFVEEMGHLRNIVATDTKFTTAWGYLANLRRQAYHKKLEEEDVYDLCEEAEEALCRFFDELGFLHRYTLASIQNIDILKYRHHTQPTFVHKTVKLMRAFGKPEQNYYLIKRNLDNRCVVLLKGKPEALDLKKRQFDGEALDFLNLSPFIIDKNAFEKNTDLVDLMFFDQYKPVEKTYIYRSVKRPERSKELIEVRAEGDFEGVYQQLEAFRKMIEK